MTGTQCPNNEILRQYLLGECPDDVSDEVERHVVECPSCEDSIAQFDTATDTLMRHLPLAAATQDASPASPGWIDVLRHSPPANDPVNRSNGKPQRDLESVDPQMGNQLADGFANYEVLGILGRGGMGVVFLARHKQLNRRVALKVVRPDALSSDMARRRFEREIQILGGLNHPGIVMATDAGVVGRGAYLVMEWIDGADLGRLVRDGGPLAIDSACEAGRQIAQALAVAHVSGVVHRDVKPSNAMVDASGRVRLLDFGLAHMTRLIQESGDTSVGHLLGTLDYMAPEQADGERHVDVRSDLYALGAMLFFLLTGRPPHGSRAGRSIIEHIRAVANEEAPRVGSLRVDVPAELQELIAKLLSRNPAERPQSATEVATQLSRWAKDNLAARVAEHRLTATRERPESADRSAACQSLAQLLGEDVSMRTNGEPPSVAGRTPPSRRHRFWVWAAIVPMAAIAFAAVVLMLKTPQGMLKIESEVDGLSVELIDEKDQVRELTVKTGNNETWLNAGQYRVRLKGTHDGMELDRDVITLRSGKDVIAHITRIPMQRVDIALQKSEATTERLYQGRTESDWRRQFQLETEPAAKLGAAKALLSLAAVLPVAEQFERILDVGDEIVRSGWNEPYLEFTLSPNGLTQRWAQTNEIGSAYGTFRNVMNDQLYKLPFDKISTKLFDTIVKGSDSRAAFATSLLFTRSTGPARGGPGRLPAKSEHAAIETILTNLDVPLTGVDRSAICQLLRLSYSNSANNEQRRVLRTTLLPLARLLYQAPTNKTQQIMVGRLLANAHGLYVPDSSPELSEILAKLVVGRMTISPPERVPSGPYSTFQNGFTFIPDSLGMSGMGGMGGGMGAMGSGTSPYPFFLTSNYDKSTISKLREANRHFLSAWIKVVNEYLEQHSDSTAKSPNLEIIRSIEVATRIESDADAWPIETTVKSLTEILRHYYTDPAADIEQSSKIVNMAASQSYNWLPAVTLSSIVRVAGRVPDFVRGGQRSSETVQKRLNLLHRFVKHLDEQSEESIKDVGAGLLFEAPYEALKVVVQSGVLSNAQMDLHNIGSCADLLKQLADASGAQDDTRMDPPLLLAILADLSGENEERDAQIATFITGRSLTKSFVGQLHEVLENNLKMRANVSRWLEQITTKSKSEKLTEAIRDLRSTAQTTTPIPAPVKDPNSTDPKTATVDERLYQGRTETDWRRQFRLETELSAKLTAAKALLSLAAVLPPREQIERILDVSEELVTSTMSGDYLVSVFDDTKGTPNLNRTWDLSQGTRDLDYRTYEQIARDQIRKLPAQELARGLSQTVVSGGEARAAAAAFYLKSLISSQIASIPDALQFTLKNLDVPLTGVNRSAVCHLVRLTISPHVPAEERPKYLTELHQLATVLHEAPSTQLKQVFGSRLLSISKELYGPGWTRDVSRVLAQLVLEQYLDKSMDRQSQFAFASNNFNDQPFQQLTYWRQQNRCVQDAWIEVVNDYLEIPANRQFGSIPFPVLQSLDLATRIRSDGDDWPLEKTAQYLSDYLHAGYSGTSDDSPPLQTSQLLTLIVRISGDLPEFVRTENPQRPRVVSELDRFRRALKENVQQMKRIGLLAESGKRLLFDAPYKTIKLSIESEALPGEMLFASGFLVMQKPAVAAPSQSPPGAPSQNWPRELRIDSVLLLTILADLTGKDDAQDSKIALFFTEPSLEQSFRGRLQILLESPYQVRSVVQKQLQKMKAGTKSLELKQAIQDLVPKTAPVEK